ncbi:MAG TPA: pantoate--beta-alanine ligase [Candidatus Eisenbacteria bacterium]|nr:pantoate--beta-alanine ligase [Candidatus Eisenbacteria bacterium]
MKLATATTPRAMRRLSERLKGRGKVLALVPTMGGLHEGHLSLVRLASKSADRVCVSLFVNPLQFGPSEDYARYPRDTKRDLSLLEDQGVDAVYAPSAEAMYRDGFASRATVTGLESMLEGASRPGHFAGVCTVVLKLVNAVVPDELWLGQKDAQQCVVLERLIADLDLPIRVRRGPTVREPDGLALSSRNAYLTPGERAQAPVLYQALTMARDAAKAGERDPVRLRERIVRHVVSAPLARLDYVEVVDPRTLAHVERVQGDVLLLVACRFGSARLIDNLAFRAGGGES